MMDGPSAVAWPSAPRAHKSPDEVKRKLSLLDAQHVHPLNEWVRELNAVRTGSSDDVESRVPWFDPSGGGMYSRILLLLEAPGRKSSASRGSGFISIDNHDSTAANLFALVHEAGLGRDDFTIWNIVPWYLPEGTQTQATRIADVLEATECLEKLLEHFFALDLVITMGTHSRAGWELLRSRSPRIRGIDWTPVPHPSATNLNTRPGERESILKTLKVAAQTIQKAP